MSRRPARSAIATLALGLGLAFVAAELAPLPGPPLYDGVVPVEAYLWLTPPPGEHGGAQGASQVLQISGGASPLVTLATPESTPQAQIFAAPGALTLPPDTTSITVSITPVEPVSLPTDGHITGNVYRITILNQAGVPATALASATVSVVLRAPDSTTSEATMDLFKGGTWLPLKTDAAGQGAQFLSVLTEFGDFALTEAGPAGSGGPLPSAAASGPLPSATATPSPSGAGRPGTDTGIPTVTIIAGAAIAIVLAGLLASAFLPRRKPRGATRRPPSRPPPRTRR